VRPLGDSAGLIDVADFHDAQRVARQLRADDVVPGAATVGVVGRLEDVPGAGESEPEHTSASHEIPVVFDGDDLGPLGFQREALEAVRFEMEVGWLGFMPGFAYLTGVPEIVAALPRRGSPRSRVRAGSFAVAGGLAGIYPSDSPGGWQLLGRTATPLFDPARPPYALLRPGDRVRLVPVAGLPEMPRPDRAPLDGGDLAVLECALALVVDGGRRGAGSLGVPRAGAMSLPALHGANTAVGNQPEAAALEVLGTLELRAGRDLLVVAASHEAGRRALSLSVDGTPHAVGEVTFVARGQVIRILAPRRVLVALSGGLLTPLVLGSRSSDPVSGLPPGPLRPGDGLALGPASSRARRSVELPQVADPIRLRAMIGPDPVPAEVLDTLAGTTFRVASDSDRTGLRLEPARAGERSASAQNAGATGAGALGSLAGGEVASHAVVPGAVQLPPSGTPMILGPDCGPVGGYAVAATVITADLWRLAGAVPGDRVELSWVTAEQAALARAELDMLVGRSISGWFPTHVT
jgi:allophanate hydrolase subunit 2/allophanate hydrolase subunit 1